MKRTALTDACDPFARVANIVDLLPDSHRQGADTPLREVMPSLWPTLGDIRKLRDAMVALGWTNDYQREDKRRMG